MTASKSVFGSIASSISIDDLARFVRQLEAQGLAGSTIRNGLIALSSVFTLALRRGWAPTNPVSGLTRSERPKASRHAHRILTPDEIRAVLDAAGERWRMLVALAVFAGLRQSELLGLTWADVDLDAARLTVRKQLERGTRARVETKTAEAVRPVPLPAFVVKMLREHRLAAVYSLDAHPVFASTSGGGLDHRGKELPVRAESSCPPLSMRSSVQPARASLQGRAPADP